MVKAEPLNPPESQPTIFAGIGTGISLWQNLIG
jgi:hypothetical protein